jgi:hypothetical protein
MELCENGKKVVRHDLNASTAGRGVRHFYVTWRNFAG